MNTMKIFRCWIIAPKEKKTFDDIICRETASLLLVLLLIVSYSFELVQGSVVAEDEKAQYLVGNIIKL